MPLLEEQKPRPKRHLYLEGLEARVQTPETHPTGMRRLYQRQMVTPATAAAADLWMACWYFQSCGGLWFIPIPTFQWFYKIQFSELNPFLLNIPKIFSFLTDAVFSIFTLILYICMHSVYNCKNSNFSSRK